MIIEEPLNNEDKWETRIAGVAVILICWVPGIVAILHLIASHKYPITRVQPYIFTLLHVPFIALKS